MKRRQFLKTLPIAAAGVAGFPTIVSASALGRQGAVAPSNRIVMAGIGFGMMGIPNMEAFLGKDEVQWVAVCDLDKNHLAEAKGIVDKKLREHGLRGLHRLPRAPRPRATSTPSPSPSPTTGTPFSPSPSSAPAATSTARSPSPTASARAGPCATPSSATAASGRPAPGSARLRSSGPPASSSATAGSERSKGSRSASPRAITISPGRSGRKPSSRRRPRSTTTCGSGPRPTFPTARPAST